MGAEAATHGSAEAVEALLEARADVNAEDAERHTAFQIAWGPRA